MIHVGEGRLQAYLDDELSGADRAGLAVHLAVCPACSAELEELRRFGTMFRSALANTDMVAGTSAAFQTFRTRRLALDGAPAAANGKPARSAASVPPLAGQARHRAARWARSSLLKAAALVLLLGGAASAAIPGSPVARLVDRLVGRSDPEAPAVQEPVQAPVAPDPQQEAVLAAPEPVTYATPADGAIRIRLREIGSTARVRVRLTSENQVAIRPADRRPDVSQTTGRGWIEVWNLGEGDVIVDVPGDLEHATIEVGGRVYYEKHGENISTPGPVLQRDANEVVFRSRS